MKVMWMGNIILPAIAEKESLPPVYIVGWLVGLSRRLTQLPDVALTYVFDAPKALTGEVDGYRYYGLVNPTRPTQRCGEAYTRQLEEILRKEQPDVIHLWGTENQHTLAMVDAAEHMGMRERIVISIQGLLSIYAEHYRAYLPEHVCHGHTLKDLVKGNIVRQEAIYRRVGQYEQEALRRVQHVIGRTDWDAACMAELAPQAAYHSTTKRCGTSSTPANGRWTTASRTASSAVRRMCRSRGCICYCRRWRLSASAIPMSSSMWDARTMDAFRRLRAMPMSGTSTVCCAKTTSTTMLFLPEA